MKSTCLIFAFMVLALTGINAQDLKYANYNWIENPKPYVLSAKEKSVQELIVKDKQAVEFAFSKEGDLEKYELVHRIVLVNSADAIEDNNKIYIPSGIRFVIQKARVISPSGKVTELSEKDIREAVEEESKAKYRYFALEGIEMGSNIEHFYLVQQPVAFSGTRELMQGKIARKNVEFEIITPSHLVFKTKSYNGFPELKSDTTVTEEKKVLLVKVDSIPASQVEESAAYMANLQYFIYKLDANLANGKNDITSYGNASDYVYKAFLSPVDKGALKGVKKLIGEINIKYARDEEDKIRTIEQYIKTNYPVIESVNPDLDDLEFILKNKVAAEDGITKLFCAVFTELNIDYQVVITTDRSRLRFDPDFEAYIFLGEYLLYLPSAGGYIAPSDPIACLGFAPPNLTHNYGLFVKKVEFNNIATGVGKVKFIDALAHDKSYDNLNVRLDFSEGILTPVVHMDREMGGYYAQAFQPYYTYLSDEEKKKANETLIKGYYPNSEIKEIKISNEGRIYFGVKPFIVKSTFTGDPYIEKAGDRVLVKIGELIGPQMEMYQKTERKMEVENEFNRAYHRIIEIEIPAGYKATNLEALNMDVYSGDSANRRQTFTSKYTMDGNKLKVDVVEYYREINQPVSEFESFRKVINAAADFNKITLVLEKV
jgi:hypothetical protein